jgi:predicted O-methyltransferase YrrM
MKQQTSTQTVLAGTTLLCLLAIAGAAGGEWALAVGGLLGFASLWLLAAWPEPKLAPVRIRSRKHRS